MIADLALVVQQLVCRNQAQESTGQESLLCEGRCHSLLTICVNSDCVSSGSFGLCDPASKEMHAYLMRLEEQQRAVLEMITGKKKELIDKYSLTAGTQVFRLSNQHARFLHQFCLRTGLTLTLDELKQRGMINSS